VPSSRRLERECQRNIEMIWLTGSAPNNRVRNSDAKPIFNSTNPHPSSTVRTLK
jgi:transposase